MTVFQKKPEGLLKEYVDAIWYIDKTCENEKEKEDTVMPSGLIHIVFNFSDPYTLVDNDELLIIPNVVIVGQFKTAIKIRYGDKVKQLGISMRPSAFMMFFKKASSLFTESYVDGIVFLGEMDSIYSQLKVQSTMELKVHYTEKYLESCICHGAKLDKLDEMIDYIEMLQGNIDISVISDKFHLSVSGFERYFKKYMGITPKSYANIVRFRCAMMSEDPTILFYDQSHFIKNCKKYTDKSPGDLKETEELTLVNMLDIR